MKAVEFDQKFDNGEDITKFLDLSKAKRSRSKQLKISRDGIDRGKDTGSVDSASQTLRERVK
jgi:hypothetical protein